MGGGGGGGGGTGGAGAGKQGMLSEPRTKQGRGGGMGEGVRVDRGSVLRGREAG